jgi:hypothetical protein
MIFKSLGAILLSAAISPLAQAASFDFTGLGGVPSGGYSTTVDGIGVTVSAPNEGLGYFNLDGIGVKTGFFNLRGIQQGETLQVSFSQEVTIGSLTFRQWEGPDRVQLSSAGGNLDLNADTAAFNSSETFGLATLGGINSFTLKGDSALTVAFLAGLNDVQVSQVPLPAAVWLFGSAVLGLAGVARRRRSLD